MQYELMDGSGDDAAIDRARVRDLMVLSCVFAATFLVYGLIHLAS